MVQTGPSWLLRGKITDDPFASFPNEEIAIKRIAITGSNASSVPDWVQNWDLFEGALLSVGIQRGDSQEMVGTAVMIAPGLAITASHVVAESLADIGAQTSQLFCSGNRSGAVDLWKLRGLLSDVGATGDLAFLSLELMSEINVDWCFTTVGITTRVPKPDERLQVFGYRYEETIANDDGGFTFQGNMFVSTGTVLAVHHPQRHATLMPFPTIELDCGSLGGMSGGAVLDAEGLLVGIISRGWQTADMRGPTYAAWIVGGLHHELNLGWPPGLYGDDPVHLLDVPEELLGIVGREAITIDSPTDYRYRVW